MIRNNKGTLILSSILIILPILIGLILWNSLPDQMVIHWGVDGRADGWSSKPFAVFALPLILLAIHWFCIFLTAKDPKNADQSSKMIGVIFWISPILSLLVNSMSYATALGVAFDALTLLYFFLGLMFTVIGNYLPKCKQSYTIGIKISWTLNSEANWLATHRIAGRIWTLCGILLMGVALLPAPIALVSSLVILTVMAVVPIVYSYRFYQKESEAERNHDPRSR